MNHTASLPLRENRRHGSQDYPCAFYEAKSSLLPPSAVFQTRYHWHEETEIIHFQSGHFRLGINMQKYDITEECFCFVGSGELHDICADGEFEEQALVFSLAGLSFADGDPVQTQFLRPLLDGELAFPSIVTAGESCFGMIRQAFCGIRAIFWGAAPGYGSREQYTLTDTAQYFGVKIRLYAILSSLAERHMLSDTSAVSGTDRRVVLIKKTLSYMKEHAQEKIYVQDLAGQVNMNEQYFCRFFKKMTGRSPIEYLTDLRVKNACKLLRHTDLSVMDVCLECGFNNLGNFLRAFRKYCGCTPGQYRKSK